MSLSKNDDLIHLYSRIPGKNLTLDLTGECNLKCLMCDWHNGNMKLERKQHLSFFKIRSIINQAVMNKIKYSCIHLGFSGEPTIHPEFKMIINYLVDQNAEGRLFDELKFNTNMVSLDPQKCHDLISSLLRGTAQFSITCSLHSASKEVDLRVKRFDFFDQIEAHTKYLIDQKKKFNLGKKLKLDLQMVILEENSNQAESFIHKWSQEFEQQGLSFEVIGDELSESNNVISLRRERNKADQVSCDNRFDRVLLRLSRHSPSLKFINKRASPDIREKTKPCRALWQSPLVHADGNMSVCTEDVLNQMSIGSLDKRNFLENLLGSEANKFRSTHMAGKAQSITVCGSCSKYEAQGIEEKVWSRFEQISKNNQNDNKDLQTAIERFNRLPGKLLTIDISNACNLYCFYCTFTQEDVHSSKKKKFLTLGEIQKVISEFLQHGTKFETLCLSVSGEPTINPQFNEIMKYLFEVNGASNCLFKYISINTNATFIDDSKIQIFSKYLKLGFGQLQLTLSINAASKESFIRTKRVDLYDKTVENCLNLLRAKAESQLEWRLNIYLLFLVNEMVLDEAEAFKIFWGTEIQKLGMSYSVDYALPARSDNSIIFKRTYSNSDLFKINQSEYDKMHQETVDKLGLSSVTESEDLQKNVPVFHQVKKKCASPWISPIIRHDGTISFCLQDVHGAMPVGNIFENSFFEMWLSRSAKLFRGKLARNEFDQWDLCQNCNYFDGVDLPAGILETYAKK